MLAYFINKRFKRAPSPTVSAAGAAMMMHCVLADPKPLLQPEFSNPKLEPESVRACVAPRRSLLRSFSTPNAAVQPWMGQALWLHPAAVCHAMRHCSTVVAVPAAAVYSAFNVSAVLQVHFHYVELTFGGGNGPHTGWMVDKRRGDDRLRPIGTLTRGGWRIHVYFDDERAKFLFLFAGRLAALTDRDPPVCIGLTGTVGVGKTHLLVMLSVAMGLGQLNAVMTAAAAHAPAQISTSMPNLQPQLVLCILFPNAGTWMREQERELVRAVSVGLEMLYMRLHGDPRQASIMQQALTAVLKAGRHNLRHDMTVDDFLTAWNPANVAIVRAVADAANAAAGVPPAPTQPATHPVDPAVAQKGPADLVPATTASPAVSAAGSTDFSVLLSAIQQLGTGLQKLDAKIAQLDAKIENIASSMRRRNPGNFFAAVFQALADLRSKDNLRVVIVVDQVNTLFAQQARDPESANPIISFLSRPEGCHMLFQSASANNEGWQLLGSGGLKPFGATPSVPLDGKLEMYSLVAPTKVPKLYVNEVLTANGLDPNLFTEKVEGALLSLGNNYLSLHRLVQYMAMNPDRQSQLPEQLVFQAVTSLQTDIELSMAEFLRKLSQPQLHRCTDIYFDLRHGLPVDLRDSDHGLLDKRYVNIAPSSMPAGVAASTQSTSAMTLQHRCPLSQAAAMKVVWSFMRHASSIRGMSDGFQYEELFVRCLHHVLGPHDASMRPRSELYCIDAVPTTTDMQRVLQSDDFVKDGFAVLRPAASARDVDLYVFLKQRDALVITVVQTTVMPVAHSQAAYAAYKSSQAADSASQEPLHPPSHESFFTRTKATLLKNVPPTLGSVKIEFLYVLGTPLATQQVSPLTITLANVSKDPPSSGLIMTRKVRGLQSYSGLLEKDNADVLHLRRPAKSARRAQSGKYHRIDKQDFATLTHVRNFPNVLVVRVLILKLATLQRLSDSMHAPYQSRT